MPRRASNNAHSRSTNDSRSSIPDLEPSGPEDPSSYSHAHGSSSRIPSFLLPQPNRDPESNWEVDLAKNLEDYLLRICSGELSFPDEAVSTVNFAEAALLLQGSVQVYSRKVEYLYTLVLQALEFISHKRQDNQEGPSNQSDRTEHCRRVDEDNEVFLGLDDVPEDPKNSLESGSNRVDIFSNYVKPPANLVVLEGDCLDSTGEAGEMESYLLSTCNFYGDFLLLDPCDAEAVQNFMKMRKDTSVEKNAPHKGSSLRSKHNLFSSPAGRSGGSRQRTNIGKKQNDCINEIPAVNLDFDTGYREEWCQPDNVQSPDLGGEQNVGSSDAGDISDDEDPWKPLNPHEPGCLKVKPFKKVTTFRRKSLHLAKQGTIASEFPIAKLNGIVSPEFTVALKLCQKARSRLEASQLPSLFEKLRKSLFVEEHGDFAANVDADDNGNNGNEDDIPDFDPDNLDFPGNTLNMDEEMPFDYEKQGPNSTLVDAPGPSGVDPLDLDASLEDLCRAHLDSLLASIAETEKQTELATRVSTWKQRIEHSLEEEDSHPPFDIHLYGEKVLAKLSSSGDSQMCMYFGDVVEGHNKREIARTFSAMLQLVNNGNIELVRKQSKHESLCYTSSNPFSIKLINCGRRKVEIQAPSFKKRLRSPLEKGCSLGKSTVSPIKSPQQNGKFSFNLSKGSLKNTSPDSKRRRRSRVVQPVAVQLDR